VKGDNQEGKGLHDYRRRATDKAHEALHSKTVWEHTSWWPRHPWAVLAWIRQQRKA